MDPKNNLISVSSFFVIWIVMASLVSGKDCKSVVCILPSLMKKAETERRRTGADIVWAF